MLAGKMLKNKRGIELSINFLVAIILAIVVFGMGLYIANMIFGGGTDIVNKNWDDFDKEVGELSCYASDNVCIHIKSVNAERGSFKTLAVTVKNGLREMKQFRLIVANTRYIDPTGESHTTGFEKLNLFGLDTGRIETLDKSEKKTFGIGVDVPKTAESGSYTLDVRVLFADADADPSDPAVWEAYTPNPYKIYVNVD